MVLVGCSHINLQLVPSIQFEIRIIRSNNRHPLGTGFRCPSVACLIGTRSVTDRGQDAIVFPLAAVTSYAHIVHFHVLAAGCILDTGTHEGIQSIVVRRFFSHVLAVICIKVAVVDTGNGVLIGQHQGVSCRNVELSIFLVSLAHISIVNLEGCFQLIHGEGQTICIGIDIFLDNIGNNSLYFAVMSPYKDIVGHPLSIFIGLGAVIETVADGWLYTAADTQRTQERVEKRQAQLVVDRQLSTLIVFVIVWIIVRPSFQNGQMRNRLGFAVIDPIVSLEVVRSNLQEVGIDIVHCIHPHSVKVSSRIIGYDTAEVHHKVEPVELFCLNSRIGIVNIIGQQKFVSAV
ncbi:hypothetical protein STRDD11_00777 [Streptococcus sp. DD11]|nr:hypothetical protein STRDD11_00777 [Streptococcus sp. DD11]